MEERTIVIRLEDEADMEGEQEWARKTLSGRRIVLTVEDGTDIYGGWIDADEDLRNIGDLIYCAAIFVAEPPRPNVPQGARSLGAQPRLKGIECISWATQEWRDEQTERAEVNVPESFARKARTA